MKWTINRYLDIVDADGEIIIHTDSGVYMPDEKYLPLILHAPEMLEALERICNELDDGRVDYYSNVVRLVDEIDELIEKVKKVKED